MRACAACRHRKIRCDAATTNTWPCSACSRLKFRCVPPATVYQDLSAAEPVKDPQESSTHPVVPKTERSGTGDQNQAPEYLAPLPYVQDQDSFEVFQIPQPHHQPVSRYYPSNDQQNSYEDQHRAIESNALALTDSGHGSHSFYSADRALLERKSSNFSDQGSATAEGLSGALGDLKIDESGIGKQERVLVGRSNMLICSLQVPYMRRPGKNVPEPAAPVRDAEIELPVDVKYGSEICIPPSMMPADEDAGRLFGIFFVNVHPYVPVVNRNHFYQQWQSDRGSISPLLLEAMLACAGRFSHDPLQGAQWLALANSAWS
jgi:hypothetical protein